MMPRHAAILGTACALLVLGCDQSAAPNASPAGPEAPAHSGLSDTEPPENAPLNLMMDRDALFELDAHGDQIDTSERADLPELVGPGANKRLTVNGGVITNDEAVGLRDRVDGAELSFELKTN